MKKYTHPLKRQTRIRFNNGASFIKHWNYYRPLLNADNVVKLPENSVKFKSAVSFANSEDAFKTSMHSEEISVNKITVFNSNGFIF